MRGLSLFIPGWGVGDIPPWYTPGYTSRVYTGPGSLPVCTQPSTVLTTRLLLPVNNSFNSDINETCLLPLGRGPPSPQNIPSFLGETGA